MSAIISQDDKSEEFDSINEFTVKFGLNETIQANITSNLDPETEFWAHCSNLQAWVENGYNKSLLHNNIAFPLLKALVDVGDVAANKVFKEEIADRINSGYKPILEYFLKENYLRYLTTDELGSALDNQSCSNLLSAIEGIQDEDVKIDMLLKVLKAIRHSDLMSKFAPRIDIIFSKLLYLEDIRREFNKQSVFKQTSSLDFSYVSKNLFGMDEALKALIFNFRGILEEETRPSLNCLLLGRGGIGKTLLAKFFGKAFKIIAIEKNVNLFVEYYNCINFRSKSKIIRELLAKYTHGSGRGFSDDEALKLILTKLINENAYMLLIIDEVHLLKPDEILALLDIAETFGHQNAKISILLICRNRDWMRIENERILSRVNQKIKLKPYNYEESFQILKYRAEIAFKENVLNDDLLEMVSQIVTEHKNLRHGIEIFRKSGIMADKEGKDRISADMIRNASNEVYPTFRADIIDRVSDQELLALYGLTASLIHKDEAFTIVDDAYDEYQTICEMYGIEPHVKMSFRKYVRTLNQLKIIASKNVRIEDADRARRLEITLLDISAEKLEEVLIDIFEKKFG